MAFAAIKGFGRGLFSKAGADGVAKAAGKSGGVLSGLKGLGSSVKSGFLGLWGKGKNTGITTGSSIKPQSHLKAELVREDKALLDQISTKQDLSRLGKSQRKVASNTEPIVKPVDMPQAAKPKSQLSRQDAMRPQRASQTPVGSATAKPKAELKPEDKALLDKMDHKQDLSKLGKAKDDITVGTKASAVADTAPEAAEPKKGGFFSNGLVQTIGGTLVGTLGLNALTSMFSGGGGSAEAAPAPAPAPAPAASPYDPYAASGSFGVPGSLPNYI